ncbi:MAG: alpha/beta hydrolase, partial [Gammaproteobacteria bacterium]
MTTSTISERPLAELLTELETAVRAGDRVRATALEQMILQRLATEAADCDDVERRVRALMAELDRPAAGPLKSLDPFDLERGSPSPDADGVVYPVWFGTNRKPTAPGHRGGDGFTGERHDRITRGRVEVYVPEAHRFGETGTSFWERLRRFDLRDDHLRIQHVEKQDRDAFFAEIQQAVQAARAKGEKPHALFFLHGFNVSFQDAAIRAAQIGVDLKVAGATAFFSWPSRGKVAAYPVDEASIEASEGAITDFLVDFTA